MHEDIVRGLFSALAAAVTLAMSSEWAAWSWEQRSAWKLLPAIVLAVFAVYEMHKVWGRVEAVLRL